VAYALPIEFHAITDEVTAGGQSPAVDIGPLRSVVRASLFVGTLTGARLDVALETSPDGAHWRSLGPIGSLKGVAKTTEIALGFCDRYVRIAWELTGTAVSFAALGEAHQIFATPADIRNAHLPGVALEDMPSSQELDALLASSDEAEGYLASGFTLPLVSWSHDLRMHVAGMAGYGLMRSRGFDPEGVDALIVKGRDDAIAWLGKIAARKLTPPGFVDSTPSAAESPSFARVRGANESRGW
jgi:phage gp36-like protein